MLLIPLKAATRKRRTTLQAELIAQENVGALHQTAKEWMHSDCHLPVEVVDSHVQTIAVGTYAAYRGGVEI